MDTLKGSNFKNLKELRIDSISGVWRVAFIFDKKRKAILLVAGNKSGKDQKLFYKRLISIAENRIARYLNDL